MRRVGAVVARSVLADLVSRSLPGDLYVDHAGFVDSGLDGEAGAVLAQVDGHAVREETCFGLVEAVVLESIRGPEVGRFAV